MTINVIIVHDEITLTQYIVQYVCHKILNHLLQYEWTLDNRHRHPAFYYIHTKSKNQFVDKLLDIACVTIYYCNTSLRRNQIIIYQLITTNIKSINDYQRHSIIIIMIISAKHVKF